MTRFLHTAVTAASLTLFAGAASAATITADYSKGDGVDIDITSSSEGSFSNVYSGNFILDPITGADIITFCVDLAHYIADGVTYEMKTLADSGFTATVQSNINRLFSTFYGTLGGDDTETAAFQTALWEIIDETSGSALDLLSGQFSIADSSVRTRAQQMLDNLGAETNDWTFTFYDADGYQDQLGAVPDDSGGVIPLPAGLPLMLTALGGLALIRRRKKDA